MTILYIGDFADYFATENYITYALEKLGHKVLRVQEADVRDARIALGAAIEHKVDFVMFSKGSFPQAHDTVALLQKHNILTVGWIFDLFFDVPRRKPVNATFKCDICCMTDGGHQKEWQQNMVRHRLLRQGIHLPDAHYGQPTPGHPEIIFLGTYSYDERIKLIDWLRGTYGDNFRQYGRGGDNREVRGTALNNLLASAKIVVGDSMPASNYWSNRIYEVTGRGGFLLHPIVEGLETEFENGKHFVGYQYGNMAQLKEKIDYYLTHDQEREDIRWAGHEHTRNNYTYGHRCQQLLKYVRELKKSKNLA